jgi:2-polyprenyl-3-methyl-5-hydroxy-6-metoxy-1,4-benzoquinol methylase
MNPKNFKCKFCRKTSGESVKLFLTKTKNQEYEVLKCEFCEAVNIVGETTLPINSTYNEEYYGEGETKFPLAIEKLIDLSQQKRVKYFSMPVDRRSVVFDVGCGSGRFLKSMLHAGWECEGIELDSKAYRRAKILDGVEVTAASIYDHPLEANSYDCVTAWHVLEHLDNASAFFEKIIPALKPKGYLGLALPNFYGWEARCFKGAWFHLDPSHHLFFVSKDQLVKYLESKGLKLIGESHFSLEYDIFGWQQSLLNCFSSRDRLYELLKNPLGVRKFGDFAYLLFGMVFVGATILPATLISLVSSFFRSGSTFELVLQKQ